MELSHLVPLELQENRDLLFDNVETIHRFHSRYRRFLSSFSFSITCAPWPWLCSTLDLQSRVILKSGFKPNPGHKSANQAVIGSCPPKIKQRQRGANHCHHRAGLLTLPGPRWVFWLRKRKRQVCWQSYHVVHCTPSMYY